MSVFINYGAPPTRGKAVTTVVEQADAEEANLVLDFQTELDKKKVLFADLITELKVAQEHMKEVEVANSATNEEKEAATTKYSDLVEKLRALKTQIMQMDSQAFAASLTALQGMDQKPKKKESLVGKLKNSKLSTYAEYERFMSDIHKEIEK